MAVHRQPQQLSGLPFEQLRYPPPNFTTPTWATSTPASNQIYAPSHQTTLDSPRHLNSGLTLPPYNALLMTSTALPQSSSLHSAPPYGQDPLGHRFPQYPTTSSAAYQPPPASGFAIDRNGVFDYSAADARRQSHPFNGTTQAQRASFSEAVDASRGIMSLSQSDITPTPRNMYGTDPSHRNPSPSGESYGFPSAHSTHSSISSASGFQSTYGGSTGDYPVTDYSSASESIDLNHRTLPPPSAHVSAVPPAPQSMMGQFSSKVSSSSQKKHKCKVCDKRFTRPSSLQTHMYSHTGEKPFPCEFEGCGRNFSVVSNLRRHRKVHRTDTASVSTNEDE